MNVIQGVEGKFNVRGNKSGGFQVFVEDYPLQCLDILSGEKSQISLNSIPKCNFFNFQKEIYQ